MNKTYKTTVIILLILGLAGIGYLIYNNKEEIAESIAERFGGEPLEERDVYGTTIGTTTTPVSNVGTEGYPDEDPNSNFSDMTLNIDNGYSTTSQVVLLNGTTDEVLFTFKALTSSSSAYVYYEIFGSNDNLASTTATSTTDNDYNPIYPLVSDITWYNVGADAALVSGTIDDPGDASNSTTTSEILTGLNWKYLKVDLRGASSTVSVRLREKINY